MLYEAVETAEPTPETVRAAYGERLRAAIDGTDPATIAEETGVEHAIVAAFAEGDVGDGTLADAAAVLGFVEGVASESVAAEIRDQLMLGMSSAILDVDTIAAEIDGDLTGQEIQQALEGRIRLTLEELAAIHALIRSRTP